MAGPAKNPREKLDTSKKPTLFKVSGYDWLKQPQSLKDGQHTDLAMGP